MLDIETCVVRVTDGTRQTADYAPTKVYELTATLRNPSEEAIVSAIAALTKAGEGYLRAPAGVVVTKGTPTKKAETPAASPATDPLEPAPKVEEVVADDPLTGAAAPAADITNDEVVHAVMQKNDQLKDATKIRALVETYNPQPGLRVFKATEIDQKDRAGFVEKLKALA